MLTFHSKCVVVAVLALALPSLQRRLSVMDIQNLVDQLGDEILTHQGLNAASSVIDNIHDLDKNRVEDFDDDEIPHPKGIHNWASMLKLGQVSGVAVNPDDEPVVFHRGSVVWDGRSVGTKNTSIIDIASFTGAYVCSKELRSELPYARSHAHPQ